MIKHSHQIVKSMIYIYLTYPLLLLVEFKKAGKIILYGGVGKIYYRLEYFDWLRLRLGFLVNVCLFIFFSVKFSGVGSGKFSPASFLLGFGFLLSWILVGAWVGFGLAGGISSSASSITWVVGWRCILPFYILFYSFPVCSVFADWMCELGEMNLKFV